MTAHSKKACKGLEVYPHCFLPLLSGGKIEWWTSRLSHCTHGKERRCLLNRGLSEPQSQSGRFTEETNLLTLSGFEPRTVQTQAYTIPALMLFSMSTELPFQITKRTDTEGFREQGAEEKVET